MKIRPCIDLHQGKVKQIIGESLKSDSAVENFVSSHSPAYYARQYKADNLPGGHIIMLGPGNQTAAMEALQAYPGGMQIGGGLNPDNASQYLDQGASHVIVTSYIFQEGRILWENLKTMVARVGKSRLVIDLSCKRVGDQFFIATDRWQKISQTPLEESLLDKLSHYCDEFLVHAADVEGKRQGIQPEVVRILAEKSPIPTTYAGGVRHLEDVKAFKELSSGRIDLTVGSALDLFGGDLPYKDLIAWSQKS